jgi:anti-sigma regulatory factor (Ser/Thr protein kinase)
MASQPSAQYTAEAVAVAPPGGLAEVSGGQVRNRPQAGKGDSVTDGAETVRWRLERSYAQDDRDAARDARIALEERADLPPSVLADLLIVVSELVANAVRHAPRVAGGQIMLMVTGDQTGVRVAVRDPGSGFTLGPPDPGREGGLGLVAVDRISNEWGVHTGEGTTVWCTLALAGSPSSERL